MHTVRVIVVVTLLAGLGLVGWFVRRVRRRTGIDPVLLLRRPSPFELVGAALLVLWAVAYVLGTARTQWAVFTPWWPPGPTGLLVGSACLLVALGLYAWSASSMGDSWRIGIDHDGDATALVRAGPYARIRHPIYTALLAGFTGATVLFPCPFTAASLPLAVIGIRRQALAEERWLLERHGAAFAEWKRTTGMFVPRFRPT